MAQNTDADTLKQIPLTAESLRELASALRASSSTESVLHFPTIEIDRSINTPARTPPARLSTLAAKMEGQNLADSTTSFHDSDYDMVDDVSEMSSDDRETVSLISDDEEHTRRGVVEEASHEEADEDVEDTETATLAGDTSARLSAGQYLPVHPQSSDTMSEEDELETPHQSTIDHTIYPTIKLDDKVQPKKESTGQETYGDIFRFAYDDPLAWLDSLGAWRDAIRPAMNLVLAALMFIMVQNALFNDSTTRMANHAERLVQLNTSLSSLDPVPTNTFNISHLLPQPTVISKNWRGMELYGVPEIRYQGAAPYIVVALPESTSRTRPSLHSVTAYRGSTEIASNFTKLIDGVYAIRVDHNEAHGLLAISMSCSKPKLMISVSHDFGGRIRHSYEQTRNDISVLITKEVAIAQDVAKTMREKLQPELEAGMRNVSLMVRSAASDLAIFADKASKTLHKAEKQSMALAKHLRKDVMSARKDIIHIWRNATEQFRSLVPSLDIIKTPIMLSRERALTVVESFAAKRRAHLVKKHVEYVKKHYPIEEIAKHHKPGYWDEEKGYCKKGKKTAHALTAKRAI